MYRDWLKGEGGRAWFRIPGTSRDDSQLGVFVFAVLTGRNFAGNGLVMGGRRLQGSQGRVTPAEQPFEGVPELFGHAAVDKEVQRVRQRNAEVYVHRHRFESIRNQFNLRYGFVYDSTPVDYRKHLTAIPIIDIL